jgi:hypothetical protein
MAGASLATLAGIEIVRCLRESNVLSKATVVKWLSSAYGRARVQYACIVFICVYCPLLVSRAIEDRAFDRYLLPLLAVGGILLMLWVPVRSSAQMKAAWALAVVLALYGIATTHDYFACSRARLKAAEMLQAAQVPRRCISAGFEYDGWTQIALSGYLNYSRIAVPANAYNPQLGRSYPLTPPYWFWKNTPSVEPLYLVVVSPQPNLHTFGRFTVNYRAWMPPFQRRLLVQGANPGAETCVRSGRSLTGPNLE